MLFLAILIQLLLLVSSAQEYQQHQFFDTTVGFELPADVTVRCKNPGFIGFFRAANESAGDPGVSGSISLNTHISAKQTLEDFERDSYEMSEEHGQKQGFVTETVSLTKEGNPTNEILRHTMRKNTAGKMVSQRYVATVRGGQNILQLTINVRDEEQCRVVFDTIVSSFDFKAPILAAPESTLTKEQMFLDLWYLVRGIKNSWSYYEYRTEKGDLDLDKELETALQTVQNEASNETFNYTVKAMVASLFDGHGAVMNLPGESTQRHYLPFKMRQTKEGLVVTDVFSKDQSLAIGDLIDSIDGVGVKESLEKAYETAIGSTIKAREHSALRQLHQTSKSLISLGVKKTVDAKVKR